MLLADTILMKRLVLSLHLALIFSSCAAYTSPWQCRPGSANLNVVYSSLVRERNHSAPIGEGTDGQIYLSPVDDLSFVAIKRFFPEHTFSVDIYREYWMGHSFTHDNFGRTHSLHRILDADSDEKYWEMRIEYIPFALLDLLDHDAAFDQPWSFSSISCVFAQLITAVLHMHTRGVAHRDLKVENVMVSQDGIVKLIDFGSAAPSRDLLTGRQLRSWENFVGTPVTIAPEVYGGRFYDLEKADVWSLGVIFLRLWLGEYPWQPDGELDGLRRNEEFRSFFDSSADGVECGEDEEEVRLLCQVPITARKIVREMLEVDPEKRISIEEVMASDWMKKAEKHILEVSR